MESLSKVDTLKEQGNLAWSLHNFDDAISLYSQGINLDNKNFILRSNRSAAFCKIGDYSSALEDAEMAIKLKKDWIKGYIRKAEALKCMGRYLEAGRTYEDGLRYDPSSIALREGRRKTMKEMCQPATLPKNFKKSNLNLDNYSPFSRTDLIKILRKDPRTREYLKDPVYVCLLDRMKKHPKDVPTIMSDQRLLITLQVLLSWTKSNEEKEETKSASRSEVQLDREKSNVEETSKMSLSQSRSTVKEEDDNLDFSFSQELLTKLHFTDEASDIVTPTAKSIDSLRDSAGNSSGTTKEEILTEIKECSTTYFTETTDSDSYSPVKDEKYLMERAKEFKQKGNEAYRSKNFDEALFHYKEGIKFNPSDMAFYSNISAVYFEKKEYEKCITECEIAIQVGTTHEASSELLAKSYLRIANSHNKLENIYAAKVYAEKAINIHPLQGAKVLLSSVEKEIKENEKESYKNPQLAKEACERGEEHFSNKKYHTAIEEFTDAIKRDPKQACFYNNRSASYFKLREYETALLDSEKACQLEPKQVESWINKGHILLKLRDMNKAIIAFEKALKLDEGNAIALRGFYQCINDDNPEATKRRALSQEEVKSIIFNPKIVAVMNEMNQNPSSISKHLKDPEVAGKIKHLQAVGLINFSAD